MKIFLKIIWQYIRRLDKKLLGACVLCSSFSVAIIYFITQNGLIPYSSSFYKTQLVSMVMGIAAALFIAALDYRKLVKLWFLYAPLAIGLVLLTFTSLGGGRDGADDTAWIKIGGMSIQPSEVLKIAFILTLSYHISKLGDKINKPTNLLLVLAHIAVPTFLIVKQGDHGSALVFIIISAAMIFSAGISWKYILGAVAALPVIGVIVWFFVLQPVHKKRIMVLFNPDLDPSVIAQQNSGKIAMGSGQIFGKGITGGDYYYVPEAHNDFIFTFIGQAFGFVGCIIVLFVLGFICIKILINSRSSNDELGQLICIGVFAMMFSHIVINIGMVLGIMPVIGVPLPFISQGGTAMLSMYISIGLVLSTHSHSVKRQALFYDAD